MTTCDEVCDTVTCQLTLNVVMSVSCLRLARWQIITLIFITITFLNLYSNVISTSTKVSRIECKCDKKRRMPEVTRDEEENLAKGKRYTISLPTQFIAYLALHKMLHVTCNGETWLCNC